MASRHQGGGWCIEAVVTVKKEEEVARWQGKGQG
jgi:hypothetical protein